MGFDLLYNSAIVYVILNSSYYITSGILYTFDRFGMFKNSKVQKTDNVMLNYKYCYKTVFVNTFVFGIVPSIAGGLYVSNYNGNEWTLSTCVSQILISSVCADILFYAFHRAFHIPLLYRLFHKKHHEIKNPVGLSTLYMSITDFYIGNILPTYIVPCMLNMHPYTLYIWILITIINSVAFAHSGFDGLAKFHDRHHLLFNKNYGINIFMDRLLGTHCAD